MTAQYRSGSAPVPASAVAFEAEKCWQLQGANVLAEVPLGVGRDVQGVVAPKQRKSNKGKVSVYSSEGVFNSAFPRQMETNEYAITQPSQLKVLCAESTQAREQQQWLRRGGTRGAKVLTIRI